MEEALTVRCRQITNDHCRTQGVNQVLAVWVKNKAILHRSCRQHGVIEPGRGQPAAWDTYTGGDVPSNPMTASSCRCFGSMAIVKVPVADNVACKNNSGIANAKDYYRPKKINST